MPDPVYQPTDRRPIASRQWKLSHLLANALVRWNISANSISVAGMISAILGGLAFRATAQWPAWGRCFWIAGAAFVQLRLLANMLDGMVAIQAQRASRLGELYNEIPDRISDAAVLIGLGYAEGSDPVA